MPLKAKNSAVYKNKRWTPEGETKFVFIALPKISNTPYASSAYADDFGYVLANNVLPPFEFRDLHLKGFAIDNLEVTLSPLADAPQEIIVQSLLKAFALHAILKKSNLGGSVKLK